MKVVLFTLDASYVHKNLAVRCLRPPLQRAGFSVSVVEYTLKEKRLTVLEALALEKGDIYGFSAYIWNVTEMLAAAEKLKKLLPDAAIIFGGPEVSYEREDFFAKHPYVDFISAGEGEKSLPALCLRIAEEGREAVKKQGRIFPGEPDPDFIRSGILYDEASGIDSSVVYYESSRGCPFRCAYCLSAAEEGVRAKDADRVLEELLAFEKLSGGIRVIKFVDRTFNFDRERAKRIWRGLLDGKYTRNYHFEVCPSLFDEETFAILGQFPKGKIQLEAGIQSTNPDTLAAIDRKDDPALCIANLKRIRDMGNIHIHADLIAGLPFEDYRRFGRSFDETFACCHKLQLGFLKLLKGSPLYRDAGKYGIVFSETPPYEVLSTRELSFEDLVRLHRIDALSERFCCSGRFGFTLEGLFPRISSPFAFLEGLAEVIPEVSSLSQLRAAELFYRYLAGLSLLPPEELNGRMRLDYYLHEAGTCPAFLAGNGELTVPAGVRTAILSAEDFSFYAPSTEIRRFAFDREYYYVIDRRHRLLSKVKAGSEDSFGIR